MSFQEDRTHTTYFEDIVAGSLIGVAQDRMDTYNDPRNLKQADMKCTLMDALSELTNMLSNSIGMEDLCSITDTLCRDHIYCGIETRLDKAKESAIVTVSERLQENEEIDNILADILQKSGEEKLEKIYREIESNSKVLRKNHSRTRKQNYLH